MKTQVQVGKSVALRHDRNYYAVLLDGVLFFTAMTFAAPATVIPAFARELGASAMIIGLAPTITTIGWLLPQLLSASYVERLPERRPFMLRMMATQRLFYLILAVLCWLMPMENPGLLLGFFLILYFMSSLFDGMATPAWLDFVARTIPERMRGSLFATRAFISGLTGLVAGWLTSLTLDAFPFPANFGFVFLWSFLAFGTGWFIFYRLTWEPSPNPPVHQTTAESYWRSIPRVLLNDTGYCKFIIAMKLLTLGTMAMPFFSVAGLDRLKLDPAYAGYFTVSMTLGQMLATLFCGRLADRRGHKINLVLACATMGAATALPLLHPSLPLYILAFMLLGLAMTTQIISRLSIVMEFAPEGARATYTGILNTLMAPVTLLTPITGGWLVELYGYNAVFQTALIINIIAVSVFLLVVQDPRSTRAGASAS